MPRVSKKAAAETAAETKEIKAVEAAPAEEKKAPAKKAAAKKTTAAKKPAAKKAAAKPAEKKTAKAEKIEENVIIQNYGKEVTASALIAKAKAVSGVKAPKKVDVYVRAEINKVYYVIDGDQFGEFALID